jgi:hypothetical protein
MRPSVVLAREDAGLLELLGTERDLNAVRAGLSLRGDVLDGRDCHSRTGLASLPAFCLRREQAFS